MSTTYNGDPNATWPAGYEIPSDGDPRNASSVNVALEALGDRTAILGARFSGFTNAYGLLAAHEAKFREADFSLSNNKIVSQSGSAFAQAYWRLELPHNATLTTLKCYFKGSPAHAGFPATRCKLILQYLPQASTTLTTVATVDDNAASLGSYEVAHDLDDNSTLNGGAGFVIAARYVSTPRAYHIAFQNEGGAGSIPAGTEVYSVQYQFTLANAPVGI